MKASILATILIGSTLASAFAEPTVEELSQRVAQLEKTVGELAKALAFLAEKPVMKGSVPGKPEDVASAKPEVIINVKADGGIIVEGKKFTLDELQQKLKAVFKADKDQPVRIRGDRDTTYQRIVEVIDVCQKEGLWQISFATAPQKKEPDETKK